MSHSVDEPSLAELVRLYREGESDDRRGPLFAAVAYAIEREMKVRRIGKRLLLDYLGAPDLYDEQGFVYRFDHKKAGTNRDEWYFRFEKSRVVSSGFNRRGINDLSDMKKWQS